MLMALGLVANIVDREMPPWAGHPRAPTRREDMLTADELQRRWCEIGKGTRPESKAAAAPSMGDM